MNRHTRAALERASRWAYKFMRASRPYQVPTLIVAGGALLIWAGSTRFTAPINPWALVKTPIGSAISARSIGGYSAGCLVGGVSLPPDGPGFQLMRLTRRRFYGHPLLIEYIMKLGAQVRAAGLGNLLIGDLGQPRGGPTNSNHRSHQTGLDVDIWFWRNPETVRRSLTLDERETLSAPSFVSSDLEHVSQVGGKYQEKWTRGEEKVLQFAVSHESVERVFVNAAIKKHLCQKLPPAKRGWLRKLRPWYGHDDHFHVRLKCPAGHSECTTQEAVPEGDGCDSSLDWWFASEAKTKSNEESASVPTATVPKLPVECDQVLSATGI